MLIWVHLLSISVDMDFPFIFFFNMVIRYKLLKIPQVKERWSQTYCFEVCVLPVYLFIWLPEMGLPPSIFKSKAFQLLSVSFKEPTMSDAWLCGAVSCAEYPGVHQESVALMAGWSHFGLAELVFSDVLPPPSTPSQFTEDLWAQVTSKVTHEWLTRIHTPELSWFLNPLLWALYHTIFQVSVLTSCKFILQHDSLKWKWAIFSDSPSTSEEALHPEYRFHLRKGDKKRS